MLRLKSLKCGYKTKTVIENLSLNLNEGSLHFVIGPNAAGKSTLLRTIAGVQAALSGETYYYSALVEKNSPRNMRPGFLPSNIDTADAYLTGFDILDIFEVSGSKWNEESVGEYLEIGELLKKPLYKMSSGEKKRLLIYCVLGHPSNIIVMDEPLNYLDWKFSLALGKVVENQLNEGRSFVFSTHDLTWVARHCESQTWVLTGKGQVRFGPTEKMLVSEETQGIFDFKSTLTHNPIDNSKLLALGAYERK